MTRINTDFVVAKKREGREGLGGVASGSLSCEVRQHATEIVGGQFVLPLPKSTAIQSVPSSAGPNGISPSAEPEMIIGFWEVGEAVLRTECSRNTTGNRGL